MNLVTTIKTYMDRYWHKYTALNPKLALYFRKSLSRACDTPTYPRQGWVGGFLTCSQLALFPRVRVTWPFLVGSVSGWLHALGVCMIYSQIALSQQSPLPWRPFAHDDDNFKWISFTRSQRQLINFFMQNYFIVTKITLWQQKWCVNSNNLVFRK